LSSVGYGVPQSPSAIATCNFKAGTPEQEALPVFVLRQQQGMAATGMAATATHNKAQRQLATTHRAPGSQAPKRVQPYSGQAATRRQWTGVQRTGCLTGKPSCHRPGGQAQTADSALAGKPLHYLPARRPRADAASLSSCRATSQTRPRMCFHIFRVNWV
jgi:hypothetical protein